MLLSSCAAFLPNMVNFTLTFFVAELRQREYNALMMVAETLTVPSGAGNGAIGGGGGGGVSTSGKPVSGGGASCSSSTEAEASATSVAGFGIVLTSTYARVCLSEDEEALQIRGESLAMHHFPALDAFLAGLREQAHRTEQSMPPPSSSSSSQQSSLPHHDRDNDGGEKQEEEEAFCLVASIIEPTLELLTSSTDIFVGIRADDLRLYEMGVDTLHRLIEEDFNFNRSTGREARHGPHKHLVPFIRRACLGHGYTGSGHHRDRATGARVGTGKQRSNPLSESLSQSRSTYTTLLSDNQEYGQAFEVRLLLSTHYDFPLPLSTPSEQQQDQQQQTAPTQEQQEQLQPVITKSVHFYIDFYDILLSHDPQSTWLLQVVNLLTPQTARRIVEGRQQLRWAAALERYKKLSAAQQLQISLAEILQDADVPEEPGGNDGTACGGPMVMTSAAGEGGSDDYKDDASASGSHESSGRASAGGREQDVPPKKEKEFKELELPFEMTKINIRVRDCVIDYCVSNGSNPDSGYTAADLPPRKSSPSSASSNNRKEGFSSRSLLSIGLLTLNSTIVSNSSGFSMKFKLAGLALHISNHMHTPHRRYEKYLRSHSFAAGQGGATAVPSTRHHHGGSGDSGGKHEGVGCLSESALEESVISYATSVNDLLSTSASTALAARKGLGAGAASGGGGEGGGGFGDASAFYYAHGFVELANIDHVEVLLAVQSSELEALVLQINLGMCTISACVDSVQLLGVSS